MFEYSYNEEAGMDTVRHKGNGSGISVRRLGGELISYRIYDEKNSRVLPLMHRDGEWKKPENGWGNHATVLFPHVGGLVNKKSTYKGSVTIDTKNNHGFTRASVFALVDKKLEEGSASLHYRLEPNEEILAGYPFQFQLDLIYTITGNVLTLEMTVKNNETEKELPFSIGWHPGFKAPIVDGRGSKMECRLLMNPGAYTHILCDGHSKLTGEKEIMKVEDKVPCSEEDLDQTVMLVVDEKENRTATLYDPAAGVKLRVDFPDFPHLGFWANTGENFICVEPWQGMDDHVEQEPFEDKFGMTELPAGETDRRIAIVTPEIE